MVSLSSRGAPLLLIALLWSCAPHRQPAPPPSVTTPTAPDGPSRLTEASSEDSNSEEPDEPPPPPSPTDTLVGAYAKRLEFKQGGPIIPVGLMEGAAVATFVPKGRVRFRVRGPVEKWVEGPGGQSWQIRITQSQPAELTHRLSLTELAFADKEGLARELRLWGERGIRVRSVVLGALYGISGRVVDNRRYRILLDEPLTAESAAERRAVLHDQFGIDASVFEELAKPPTAILELLDEAGSSVALGQDLVAAETPGSEGFLVRRVEYGRGYDFHGFEDRVYRGALVFTADRNGKLAVVNLVALEDHLRGLVPSEIFARAPAEALKAQAVTARGEVLAKVGIKHLADPYLLCAEQHCAVYRGQTGETPSTNAAVSATSGEGLFSREGRLVDSVYSAVCGGHTEDNDSVWGGLPNPHLRGKPDLLPDAHPRAQGQRLPSPRDLIRFLETPSPAACRLSSFAPPAKYRWERSFTADEVDAMVESLRVGSVRKLTVRRRGRSGRAEWLTVVGENGSAQVRGELNIRKLFRMLNSAMFVVERQSNGAHGRPGWRFRGGGWGHGVGMCQTGAIGRAEAGQDYREILRFYFSGAEVAPIYPPIGYRAAEPDARSGP